MPAVPVVYDRLQDLTDVSFASIARGHVIYRGAATWNNLAPGASGQYLQTNGAGADPSWATVSAGATTLDGLTDVNLPAASQGDILYRNAAEWVRLAAGTSGQTLQTNGAAANPSWVTPTPGVTAHSALTGLGADDHAQYALLLGRAGGQTLIGGTASGNPLTLRSTSHATKGTILLDGTVTSPGAGTGSERFGVGTLTAGTNALALGLNASGAGNNTVAAGRISAASGGESVAVGYDAQASALNAVAVGQTTRASGQNSVALGPVALASATSSLAIGNSAQATAIGAFGLGPAAVASATNALAAGTSAAASGTNGMALGQSSVCAAQGIAVGDRANVAVGHSLSIALGVLAATTAANQWVVGNTGAAVTEAYFGKGVTAAAPGTFALNATGGSGADITGAALVLAAGKGTGAGLGGDLVFQSTVAGASSATLNTLRERWRMVSTGVWRGSQLTSVQDRTAYEVTPTWATSTDASRKARVTFSVFDTAAREALRIEADGSNPMLGLLGATATARETVTGSRGGNAALADLLTKLATKGIITDGSSA